MTETRMGKIEGDGSDYDKSRRSSSMLGMKNFFSEGDRPPEDEKI